MCTGRAAGDANARHGSTSRPSHRVPRRRPRSSRANRHRLLPSIGTSDGPDASEHASNNPISQAYRPPSYEETIMSLPPSELPSNQPSDREFLTQMISGGLVTQLVHVAARLGIADLLADGARSSEDLASSVEA